MFKVGDILIKEIGLFKGRKATVVSATGDFMEVKFEGYIGKTNYLNASGWFSLANSEVITTSYV